MKRHINTELSSSDSSNIKGNLFFGKTKYNKTTSFYMSFKEYKGSFKETKTIVAVLTEDTNNNDIKRMIKTAYFIVDPSLKIINITSFTQELIQKLNRKFSFEINNYYFTDMFPEVLKTKSLLQRDYTLGGKNYLQSMESGLGDGMKTVGIRKVPTLVSTVSSDDGEDNLRSTNKNTNKEINRIIDESDEKINFLLKTTVLSLGRDEVEIEIRRRKESEIDIEPEIYSVLVSINHISEFINPETDNKNKSEDEDDENDTHYYVIKMKVQLRNHSNISSTQVKPPSDLPMIKKYFYPKIHEIYHELKGKDKKLLDIIKAEKEGLMKFYELIDTERKDDFYKDLITDNAGKYNLK